jgi:hypothetical protein
LTKEDSLDDQFARGDFKAVTDRLKKQVEADLIKDFEVPAKDAKARSNKFVMGTIGPMFKAW